MNLPNRLTIARLAITAAFVASLSINFRFNHTLALVLFFAAMLTDYFDGQIARRWNLITDFGKLMDPLADKVLTASAFICLLPYHALAPWAVIIIISREFLITGLRMLAGSKGIVLPAEKLGKHKTAWQMGTIIYFLLLLTAKDWQNQLPPIFATLWSQVGLALVAVTVILTIYSGLAYLWKNRGLLSA